MNVFDGDVWSMRARKRALRRKRRLQAALVLAVIVVLGLIVWLAVIGSMWLPIVFAALFLGAAGFVVHGVWRAVAKGELRGRDGNVTFRHASPVGFWFQIANYILIAVFMLFGGLALLGLAPHWFLALLRSMHHR